MWCTGASDESNMKLRSISKSSKRSWNLKANWDGIGIGIGKLAMQRRTQDEGNIWSYHSG